MKRTFQSPLDRPSAQRVGAASHRINGELLLVTKDAGNGPCTSGRDNACKTRAMSGECPSS
eukprot:9340603-Pyramimonas_sp.AAC.2